MATTSIRVALDWQPNTIHSGLFVAREKGLYKEHGLDVQLLPPDENYSKTPAKQLETGEVDLAICPSESCIAYNESGKMRLQAIYAILQKDASAVVSTSVKSMRELGDGKKYGSYNARYEDKIVEAMVIKDGGDAQQLRIERSEGKLSLFDAMKAGRVDATWIFLPWEGIEAKSQELDATYFRLADYGIPYGYSPVISRHTGNSLSDETLQLFLKATREGYQRVTTHPEEAVDLLHAVTGRSKGFLSESQASINEYYRGDEPDFGYMDPAKWSTWLQWLRENRLLVPQLKEEDIFTNAYVK